MYTFLFVGTLILIVDLTALWRSNESNEKMFIGRSCSISLGNQSSPLRSPFCYSIRYRVERTKRSFRIALVCRPPAPLHIQSWHEHFRSAGGQLNIEAHGGGGGGGGGVEDRFFSLDPGTIRGSFFTLGQ